MTTILKMDADTYASLVGHLLPQKASQEQAAFLFAQVNRCGDQMTFHVNDAQLLAAGDFAIQDGDYLELADHTRAGLIKQAHDLHVSLIEAHSHPGPWPAAFSLTDRVGLAETVPHMWWRLRGRPYVALVFAPTGFDALVWIDTPQKPRSLDALVIGDRVLRSTNLSLKGWR